MDRGWADAAATRRGATRYARGVRRRAAYCSEVAVRARRSSRSPRRVNSVTVTAGGCIADVADVAERLEGSVAFRWPS